MPPAADEMHFWRKPDSYLRVYEKLLGPLRTERFAMLELGVAGGHSLQMWRDTFPYATVVGVDLDPPAVDLGPRVTIARGDQADPDLLGRLRRDHAPGGFNVIIDDASHVGVVSARSLQALFGEHLRPGGLYLIEDWQTGYIPYPAWPDGAAYRDRLDADTLSETAAASGGSANGSSGSGGDARMPSHDAGMVGLVKRLIDHVAAASIRDADAGCVDSPLPIESMTVHPGVIALRKAADPAATPA
jgi:hypothetical protein